MSALLTENNKLRMYKACMYACMRMCVCVCVYTILISLSLSLCPHISVFPISYTCTCMMPMLFFLQGAKPHVQCFFFTQTRYNPKKL